MKFGTHIVDSFRRVRRPVTLIRHQKFEQPAMENVVLENDLSVLTVPLHKHKNVLKSSLSYHVVRMRHKFHQNLHRRQESYLIVVVDH